MPQPTDSEGSVSSSAPTPEPRPPKSTATSSERLVLVPPVEGRSLILVGGQHPGPWRKSASAPGPSSPPEKPPSTPPA